MASCCRAAPCEEIFNSRTAEWDLRTYLRRGLGKVEREMLASVPVQYVEDGRVLDVNTVIWCTGFTPDYGWIDLLLATHHGLPLHDRGIVRSCPGLYFVGLLFLYSLSSTLVGGVGRDARHIVNHIVSTRLQAPRSLAQKVIGTED